MEDGSSYWINAVESDTLTVHGTEAGQIGPSYPVHSDWNMIGFSSTGDITPEKYLDSVIADCSLLYCWLEGSWTWWMKENPGSTLSIMKPGSGYWLDMNAGGTITPT